MKLACVGLVVSALLMPSMLRAEDGKLLFEDDFATLKPGWGSASDSKDVKDHQLLISLKPNLAFRTVYDDLKVENGDIRVKLALAEGDANQPGGLVFSAADRENGYVVTITPAGQFNVLRRMNGKWMSIMSRALEAIKQGVGETNELRVVTSGRAVTIYVNDQQAATLTGMQPVGGGKVGVLAESGQKPAIWTFTDLSVRQGPSPAGGNPAADDKLLWPTTFTRSTRRGLRPIREA